MYFAERWLLAIEYHNKNWNDITSNKSILMYLTKKKKKKKYTHLRKREKEEKKMLT